MPVSGLFCAYVYTVHCPHRTGSRWDTQAAHPVQTCGSSVFRAPSLPLTRCSGRYLFASHALLCEASALFLVAAHRFFL